ncbi:ABC transporter permease [Thermorudis peleae]|uniref:ABC transporter permease n=1 Tax=Thermorudis peleae TaxID=1382356 RepID=UPI001E2E4C08|nr:ABC transporter permease [Thermorudis peleae]
MTAQPELLAMKPPSLAHRLARSLRLGLSVLWQNKVGFLGFLGVLFFIALALFGPLIAPSSGEPNMAQIYQPPSWSHPLGTDYEGRDVLTQVVRGGRPIILVGALAAILSTLIAITLGALVAYVEGVLDSIVMLITDVVLTIPQLPLLVVLAAFVRLNRPWLLALILALLNWPTLLRAVRAQVLSLKAREYVEAARALDLGLFHILFREILPNMASYILMSFTIGMTGAIYGQVVLYFLGLAPLAGDNWGIMLNLAWTRGAIFYRDSMPYILAPVIAISLLQLSMVTMTRSLEQVFNPRLREG